MWLKDRYLLWLSCRSCGSSPQSIFNQIRHLPQQLWTCCWHFSCTLFTVSTLKFISLVSETVLPRVISDFKINTDNHNSSILSTSWPQCSVEYCWVCHSSPTSWTPFSIKGTVLDWFSSYPPGRCFSVLVTVNMMCFPFYMESPRDQYWVLCYIPQYYSIFLINHMLMTHCFTHLFLPIIMTSKLSHPVHCWYQILDGEQFKKLKKTKNKTNF